MKAPLELRKPSSWPLCKGLLTLRPQHFTYSRSLGMEVSLSSLAIYTTWLDEAEIPLTRVTTQPILVLFLELWEWWESTSWPLGNSHHPSRSFLLVCSGFSERTVTRRVLLWWSFSFRWLQGVLEEFGLEVGTESFYRSTGMWSQGYRGGSKTSLSLTVGFPETWETCRLE